MRLGSTKQSQRHKKSKRVRPSCGIAATDEPLARGETPERESGTCHYHNMSTTTIKQLKQFPRTLDALLNHPDFHPFPRSSDEWLYNPDRMERCEAAAENGADGSTHAERLEDMREALREMRADVPRSLNDRTLAALDGRVESIEEEIDACEAWHEANGSLHEEIG